MRAEKWSRRKGGGEGDEGDVDIGVIVSLSISFVDLLLPL